MGFPLVIPVRYNQGSPAHPGQGVRDNNHAEQSKGSVSSRGEVHCICGWQTIQKYSRKDWLTRLNYRVQDSWVKQSTLCINRASTFRKKRDNVWECDQGQDRPGLAVWVPPLRHIHIYACRAIGLLCCFDSPTITWKSCVFGSGALNPGPSSIAENRPAVNRTWRHGI